MKIRAPAKINLSLRVVGKRADGYHLLDTIMLPVSLYDDIFIHKERRLGKKTRRPKDRLTVTCDDPSVPQGRKNLAYKAAALLLKEGRIDEAVRIRIHKRIPIGAGLGGGSTDAAATLIGLNRLFRLGYTLPQLEKTAGTLGADVPFFIQGVPARARGIGERLTRLRGMPRFWCVIVYPNFPISTAWVYRNLQAKLTKAIVNTSINPSLGSAANLQKLLVNDLEAVAMGRYPRIRLLKEELARQGAVGTLMSGSGSSVFGVFPSKRRAERAFRRLRKEREVEVFLVHALS
ncbi:MAG TPA: 4-(cytidine 5'-diphospho)-2-C-methyl-D-erythritol kinase [Candidatus Binatia bacterium]|nr:4-(cytidine 5'-diphospho)-2-C-methyl-D-erythritol kinase [Candidatus Binatia bacterium]